MSIVSTDWLYKNLNNVKIIDCSWHLPNQNRDPHNEFLKNHIPNSIFFDLDKYSDLTSDLPHMLPNVKTWEKNISSLGIKNNDRIIIYDNSDVLSSCRCWYNFIYFGHNPKLIKILNGGLRKWKRENKETTEKLQDIKKTKYSAHELKYLVKNKKQIDKNISESKFKVIDARSLNRFKGLEEEPRKGLRSGSIENSYCLPFNECINNNTNEFLDSQKLEEKFKKIINDTENINIIFTCGSGVTAAVLAFAFFLVNNKYLPIIYDGSWSEYGKYPS